MKNWSDTLVTFAANVSAYLGPVTRVVDSMTDRLVSTSIAEATICPPVVCGTWCGHGCNDSVGAPHTFYTSYGWTWQQCAYGFPSCSIGICYSC